MKKSFVFFIIISLLMIFSCTSFRIPSEERIILKNLAIEYDSIADAYMEIKNYNKAIKYYKLAMRNEDLKLTAYYKLAKAYAYAQDWDSALRCYNDFLSKDSENVNLKLSVAYITAMTGEIEKSLEMFKKLNEENPYIEQILENYIIILLFVGRTEEANPVYLTLKERFPNNSKITEFAQKISENAEKK